MFTGFHLARCSNGSCAIEVHVCQSAFTFFQRDNTGYIFFVCLFVFFCLFQTEPLAFLMQPKTILLGYLGQNLQINCSTNDENATVSLLHKRHSLTVFTKRKPEANKLLIQGEVFTLLNLDLSDGGMYSCEAKDQANNRIRWPRGTGYLILSQGKLRN